MYRPAAASLLPRAFSVLLALALLLGPWTAPFAGDELPQLCKLILNEENNDREDLALELDTARIEVEATEDVFALVDRLWKAEATELLSYLGYKRNRDFARVDVKRAAVVLERQDALLEESRLLCRAAASDGPTEAQRGAITNAHERYLRLDCTRLGHRIEMAKVELDYAIRVKNAYDDLQEFAAAAAIDVMEWNYNVEVAREKLAHAKKRTATCRAALGDS